MLQNYTTRRELRAETGWSMGFITKHVPFRRVGGKILIDRRVVTAMLADNYAPFGTKSVEYADGPREVPVAPIHDRLPARRGGSATIEVICPYCGRVHEHGEGAGSRIAHCKTPVPGTPSEYYVPA